MTPIIYGMSDLHGHVDFPLPACDLLLIAGDVGPDSYQRQWFRKEPLRFAHWWQERFLPWLEVQSEGGQRIRNIVLTWGNHDWTKDFPPGTLTLPPYLRIVVDELIEVEGLKIWGSPWCNPFMNWSWMKAPKQLRAYYEAIPTGTDIILTNQPPQGKAGNLFNESLGSHELMVEMVRIQPKAVVCGHIHYAHGQYVQSGALVYNVALVDESYTMIHKPTEIKLIEEEFTL